MTAYVVANIDETDPVAFESYRHAALPVVAQYGGRSLIRHDQFERLEGSWSPRRLVIVEFPSLVVARQWYRSPEYRLPRAMRHAAARTDMLLYKGRDEQ